MDTPAPPPPDAPSDGVDPELSAWLRRGAVAALVFLVGLAGWTLYSAATNDPEPEAAVDASGGDRSVDEATATATTTPTPTRAPRQMKPARKVQDRPGFTAPAGHAIAGTVEIEQLAEMWAQSTWTGDFRAVPFAEVYYPGDPPEGSPIDNPDDVVITDWGLSDPYGPDLSYLDVEVSAAPYEGGDAITLRFTAVTVDGGKTYAVTPPR